MLKYNKITYYFKKSFIINENQFFIDPKYQWWINQDLLL